MVLVFAFSALAAAGSPPAQPAPRFVAGHSHLEVDGTPLTIRGVNLGAARPGERPTDHAVDQATFARWFEQMSDLGINSVRVFALQNPAFYRALAAHNRGRRSPLFLLQGVWLDDSTGDLWGSASELDKRAREVIDVVHGNREIAKRRFRAHGKFDADVSEWTLGLIIGREILPNQITATNRAHRKQTRFRGSFLELDKATPSEVWIAGRLDAAIRYESRHYQTTRPVATVSWPLLDPLRHPTAEPGMDRETIDITKINSQRAPAGLFAAYSVYPYYPRFISREPSHRVKDHSGPNVFLGYLKRLVEHYRGVPVVVAEYGVPSSPAIVTREPVSGMSFGGHDEATQAKINRRLRDSVESSGCAGGVAFAWLDEWWKPTWILRQQSNADRLPMWHDRLSPEQNFGMVAFDSAAVARETTRIDGNQIRSIELVATADALEVQVELADATTTVDLAFDLGTRHATKMRLSTRNSVLEVARKSALSLLGVDSWLPWSWKTPETETPGNLAADAIERDESGLRVRIPWTLLNMSDPSRQRVATRVGSQIVESSSTGIVVSIVSGDATAETKPFRWDSWNAVAKPTERLKPAARIYLDPI